MNFCFQTCNKLFSFDAMIQLSGQALQGFLPPTRWITGTNLLPCWRYQMKICKKCGSTERYKCGQCKPCTKAATAARYKGNPEPHKAYSIAWGKANRERARLTAVARRKKNPERARAIRAAWRAANPEKVRINRGFLL
jgi:hypothetical protein